ncbi:putative fatty acyl-CoA reductase CG5065 isoform X2 [Epargyreus clarus]|uniref:putative fatty acyl-CoA reductase CG5065 isoform X2 n=1 Tax=Epargyreus clarus TaxID=520877 RepID=UPI003C2B56FF
MNSNKMDGGRYQPISDMYDGKSVFVTGCTGFLGKVFVEKILYRCPKIEKVYVLIRETEKISAEEKFKKMLDCPLFERLRRDRPQDLEKVIPIIGDISEPNLGITLEDEELLLENVSIVFHFAATIKFNEPLQVAINVNLEGTRRVLDLVIKMKKIPLFLYVSTAFSNPNIQVVEEVVYPPPIPLSDIDAIMEHTTFSEEQTRTILNGSSNTYTFTKALAENLVVKFHEQTGIPTIIVRPSIMVSCKDEPMSGWIDNWFGATALVVTDSKGLNRAIFADGRNTIDLIPADYVANLIIVAAARCQRSKNVQVYNSCSSAVNPITLRELDRLTTRDSIKNRTYELPLPGVFFIRSRWIMAIVVFILEILPAYIADCILKVLGKKQKYIKMQSRVTGVRKALEPFTSRTWIMKSVNTSALYKSLSPTDRRTFACDAKYINWEEFIPTYFQGIRKYLLDSKK